MKKLSTALLKWFDKHGRHDLPWQKQDSPYHVWVSEIMLQQTQVSTVIPYYQRFIRRFKTVKQLANADIDEVLHLWTGLGYYARARNLHRTASIVSNILDGQFPDTIEQLQQLPGIGRSTAGAIVTMGFQKYGVILDGNVKRVLARYHAVEGWYGQTAVLKELWQLAEQHTPKKRVADYTQAIMDLGATVCSRTKPDCSKCPLSKQCQAFIQQRQQELPHRKPRKSTPVKQTYFAILINDDNEVLLKRRPTTGIWGGLWSFQEFNHLEEMEDWLQNKMHCTIQQHQQLDEFRHTFSHYHLDITPVVLRVSQSHAVAMDIANQIWYNFNHELQLGLAAPVKKLLEQLQETQLCLE